MLCELYKEICKRAPETAFVYSHLCSSEWGQPFLSNSIFLPSVHHPDQMMRVKLWMLHCSISSLVLVLDLFHQQALGKLSVSNMYLREQDLKGRTKNFVLFRFSEISKCFGCCKILEFNWKNTLDGNRILFILPSVHFLLIS